MKQKFGVFQKSYYSGSRSRGSVSGKDGPIYSNGLRFRAVYCGIVSRSSMLGVTRVPKGFFWLHWYFVKFWDGLKLVFSIFILFNKWQPFHNDEKSIFFHLKSSFCSRDIQIFAFLTSDHCSSAAIDLEENRSLKLRALSIV